MGTAATPLSDAITRFLGDASSAAFVSFVSTFRESTVGVVASTLPTGRKPGETFQAGAGDVQLVVVNTPDGRRMLKTCADPETFAVQFPETKINALMSGEEVLGMLAKALDLQGVLVCSAASFHSVPITREDLEALPRVETNPRPSWWKFWAR